jgi:hypothetical protein
VPAGGIFVASTATRIESSMRMFQVRFHERSPLDAWRRRRALLTHSYKIAVNNPLRRVA